MEEEVEGGVSWIVIVAVVAVIVAAIAFFAGRAMAGDGGPATLSEAVEQAQAGDLPCGDVPAAQTPPADGQAPTGGAPGAGGPGGGGASFALRAICSQDGQNGQAGGQGQGGMPGGGGFGGRGGFAMEVKSVDGTKLTVTGPQGDQTIEIGPETTISKSTPGEAADLEAGDNVIVGGGRQQGQAATSVLIVPASGSN